MTASIRAYQSAEAVMIAPIEYSYLIFAAAIDFFLWQIMPGVLHVLGAILIFGSGSLIAVREWKAGQRT
jgi:S-adenosylmethionine uptake transporter